MPSYENARGEVLEPFLVTLGGFFFAIFIVFLCAGKKKDKKQSNERENEVYEKSTDVEGPDQTSTHVDIPEVVITTSDVDFQSPVVIGNGDGVGGKGIQDGVADVEEPLGQYDPQLRRSENSQDCIQGNEEMVDPYETIGKPKKNPNVDDVKSEVTENSGSGSGNSDSGGAIYTRVKKVAKPEEIAYAVVDIKESQEKYEIVNGDIVRKKIRDSLELSDDTEPQNAEIIIDIEGVSTEDKEMQPKVEVPEENSGSSGLYTSVSDNHATVNLENPQSQSVSLPSSEDVDEEIIRRDSSLYARVVDKPNTDESTQQSTALVTGDDQGNLSRCSSLYASVSDSKSMDPDKKDDSSPQQYAATTDTLSLDDKDDTNIRQNSDLYASVSEKSPSTINQQQESGDQGNKSNTLFVDKQDIIRHDSGLYESVSEAKSNGGDRDFVDINGGAEEATTEDVSVMRNDEYAVVVKPKKQDNKAPATMGEFTKEDSGGSGLYAAVSNEALNLIAPSTPPPPPPPPPVLPPHPVNMKKRPSFDQIQIDSAYEPISGESPSNSLERDNTYDSISDDLKVNLKKNPKKESKHKGDKHDNAHHNATKKHHSKQDSKSKNKNSKENGQGGTVQSPKPSKFFRGNPFKHSKKHRKSAENINNADVSAESNNSDYEGVLSTSDSSLVQSEKVSSLPSTARKNPIVDFSPTGGKRNSLPSLPNIPPPLPPVEKIKHLKEHQKNYRTSSMDAYSSPESSPKSSPRTPSDKHTPHAKLSPQISAANLAFQDGVIRNGVETGDDEFEEDDNYSVIKKSDKNLLTNGERNNNEDLLSNEESLVEEDKYSKVKDEDTSTETKVSTNDPVDVVTVTLETNATINTTGYHAPALSTDYEELETTGNLNVVPDDLPDYAMVDLTKKYMERRMTLEKRPERKVKEPMPEKESSGVKASPDQKEVISVVTVCDDDYEAVTEIHVPRKEKDEFQRHSNNSDYMFVE